MALRVLDAKRGDAEAGMYYAGMYRLLGDLGQMPTRTAQRHLWSHLQTLETLGLIKRVRSSAPGERAVYKLDIPVDNRSP